jgi:hypothetical protein
LLSAWCWAHWRIIEATIFSEQESVLKYLPAFIISLLFVLLNLSVSQNAYAHGADDHEHAAPAGLTNQVAPRASAQTEDFEFLMVLQGRQLIIYLDRFADNQPVIDAKLELESGGLKAIAKQSSPGVYVLDLTKGWLEKSGKYAFSISVEAGDLGDVMTASLEIPELTESHEDEHDHSSGFSTWWKWLLATGVLLILATLAFAMWRRKQRSGFSA